MEPEANDDEGIIAEISKIVRLFSSGDGDAAALQFLKALLDDEAAKEDIRRCRAKVALRILDLFEIILPKLRSSNRLRRRLLRLSSRLAEASRQMPSNSILQNITWESHPTGGGGHGEVRKGTYCNKTVAVKSFRIQKDQRPKWPALDGKICREALTWKHLDHPTLLPFLGVCCIDPEYGFKSMVSPWCERGNISNYFREGNHLPNVEKSLDQLASGIRYMHSENVVHGDLTGNNVLLTDQGDLQICDFGLVKWNETSLITGGSRALGTYRYMAPELFGSDGLESDSARPSLASDVYAFACLALEMYTGRVPFFGCIDVVVPGRVMAGQRPARPDSPVIPDHLWDLIKVCWSQEPTARPSMKKVVTSMVLSRSSGHGDALPGPVSPGSLQSVRQNVKGKGGSSSNSASTSASTSTAKQQMNSTGSAKSAYHMPPRSRVERRRRDSLGFADDSDDESDSEQHSRTTHNEVSSTMDASSIDQMVLAQDARYGEGLNGVLSRVLRRVRLQSRVKQDKSRPSSSTSRVDEDGHTATHRKRSTKLWRH